MKTGWMIRAGGGGRIFEDFEKGIVAVGWKPMGDLSNLDSREKMAAAHVEAFPESKRRNRHNSIAMVHKFRNVMKTGDVVLTYDPQSRTYLVGEIKGDYVFDPKTVPGYPQTRKVSWLGKLSRDDLTEKARNSLGSAQTLFKLKDYVLDELFAALTGKPNETVDLDEADEDEVASTKEDTVNRSKELIKDKIIALDADEMEELAAALIRAMGFRARVTPKGPDRGVDVVASPDGLGLQEPRIKCEVKHRGGSIGAGLIRGFIGALRAGDKGIYISTGGFSREARYEAERANIPITLVDIDTLAELVVDYYENFDLEGKALIPLVRIYWPADM